MKRLLTLILILSPALPAQTRHVVAISHRGEHLHHPENTMPAFQEAVRLGADYIEVDVRTSSDGKLVLSHDANFTRCTNGTGDVSKMTFDEIRALDAGIKIYVDVKSVTAKELVDHIVGHGMQDHVVIYSGRISKDIQDLNPKLKIMPEASTVELLQRVIPMLHPPVWAFGAGDWKPEIIKLAKDSGAEVYVDRQGSGLTDSPAGWQAAIDMGADGIQTDRPGELVQYLREKGYKSKE